MNNPIVHFEIMGSDGPALTEFYRALFGWELRRVPMDGYQDYSFIPSPEEGVGVGGGLGQLEDGDALVTIYVEVTNLQQMLDRAVEAGAQIVLPRTEIPPEVTIARFRDPQGNIVGLIQTGAATS